MTGSLQGFFFGDELLDEEWIGGGFDVASYSAGDGPLVSGSPYNNAMTIPMGAGSIAETTVDLNFEVMMPLLLKLYASPSSGASITNPADFSATLSVSNDGFSFEDVLSVFFDVSDNSWQFGEGVFHPHPWQVSKKARVTLSALGTSGTASFSAVGLYNDPSVTCSCSDGFYLNLDTPNCRTCSPQPSCRSISAECYRCPAGRQCATGVMLKCEGGEYSWGGSSTCDTCPQGWMCESGLALPCASDGSVEVNGACLACPEGYNCRNGVAYICPRGKYGKGGASSSECLNCEPGKYAPAEGLKVCQDCLVGKTSGYGHEDCYSCDEGSSTGAVGKFPCVSL